MFKSLFSSPEPLSPEKARLQEEFSLREQIKAYENQINVLAAQRASALLEQEKLTIKMEAAREKLKKMSIKDLQLYK